MSGRGCTLHFEITKHSGETNNVDVSVAAHSPLIVLKERLEELSDILIADQAIILCDLSDRDRNNDRLLSTTDDMKSLVECGIVDGSHLTLHPIGKSLKRSSSSQSSSVENTSQEVHYAPTPISPAQADHSYNGIIFDVASKGTYEVTIVSVSVGGMLGRMRIFARETSWEDSLQENDDDAHYWAHHHSISPQGWECVCDVTCQPSWDKAFEIRLQTPIRIFPRQKRAIYIHSGLPEDLGIQYQSYPRSDSIVLENEHMVVFPGVGHTGSEPFDEVHGWYRSYRGLSGGLSYTCQRKGWNVWEHRVCPPELQDGVKTLLLCHQRALNTYYEFEFPPDMPGLTRQTTNTSVDSTATDASLKLMSVPLHLVYYILEFMDWDWFPNQNSNADYTNEEKADERNSERGPATRRSQRLQNIRQAVASSAHHVSQTANSTMARILALLYMGHEVNWSDLVEPEGDGVVSSYQYSSETKDDNYGEEYDDEDDDMDDYEDAEDGEENEDDISGEDDNFENDDVGEDDHRSL